LEHAAPSIEPLDSSNVGSNVARKGEGVGRLGSGPEGEAEGEADESGIDSAGEEAGPEGKAEGEADESGIDSAGEEAGTESEKLGGAAEGEGAEATDGIGVGNTTDGGA
jgi:hypothetical protein